MPSDIVLGLYGLVIVVLGITLSVADAITKTQPYVQYYAEIFSFFIYGGSIGFLVFMLLKVAVGKRSERNAARNAAEMGVSFHKFESEAGSEKGEEVYAYGQASLEPRKLLTRSVSNGGAGTSLFLRLGALVFLIAVWTYNGLSITSYALQERRAACYGKFHVALFILQSGTLLLQTFFFFKHHKVLFYTHTFLVKLGFLHLIATNMWIWVSTVISECYEDYHFEFYNPMTFNLTSGETMNEDAAACYSDKSSFHYTSSQYLYPRVIEYALAATVVLARMYTDTLYCDEVAPPSAGQEESYIVPLGDARSSTRSKGLRVSAIDSGIMGTDGDGPAASSARDDAATLERRQFNAGNNNPSGGDDILTPTGTFPNPPTASNTVAVTNAKQLLWRSATCYQSHFGLFSGMTALVLSLAAICLFLVFVTRGDTRPALATYYTLQVGLLVCGAIAIVSLYVRTTRRLFYIDDVSAAVSGNRGSDSFTAMTMALNISFLGVLAHCVLVLVAFFNLIGNVGTDAGEDVLTDGDTSTFESDQPGGLLDGINVPLEFYFLAATTFLTFVQSALQTAFILDASRRCVSPASTEGGSASLSRGAILFVLLVNAAMWFAIVFESRKAGEVELMRDRFSVLAWSAMSHIVLPLASFYRFVSAACLWDIWRKTSCPKFGETVHLA